MTQEAAASGVVRKAIDVTGHVQGVGFRPFVRRLAGECNLVGTIAGAEGGLSIEVQGDAASIDNFLVRLLREAPPQARIDSCIPRETEVNGDVEFRLASTHVHGQNAAHVPTDRGLCDDCLRELSNPRDRRFRYPFINCKNCGPAFTIGREVPYGRINTSMAAFTMCALCRAEYDDPGSRQFHGQANSCWDCGPQVKLFSTDGEWINIAEPIREAARMLEKGAILAVKGLGGFQLVCDAKSESAVDRLRERKGRSQAPFAVMVRRIEDAERLCSVDAISRRLLLSPERPVVVLPQRTEGNVATGVAPRLHVLGMCLPSTAMQYLLAGAAKCEALAVASGSAGGEPNAIRNDQAVDRLKNIADAILGDDREILQRCEESTVRVVMGRSRILGRSRGFVPSPIWLEEIGDSVLAVGVRQNTICILRGAEAFLGQPADVDGAHGEAAFLTNVEHLRHILEVETHIIAHDLDPGIFPTQWAQGTQGPQIVAVQHHHAHVASCMAENHLEGKLIGIVLDEGGYGSDGATWGAEVLVADYRGFERTAHLKYFAAPPPDGSPRDSWSIAAGLLKRSYENLSPVDQSLLPQWIDSEKREAILRDSTAGHETTQTSACARLFEGVAAILGICPAPTYEGQADRDLEIAASATTDQGTYRFDLAREGTAWEIGTQPLFDQILRDLRKEVHVNDIARRFYNGLTAVFAEAAEKARSTSNENRVCLSGSCFENVLLFELMHEQLRRRGFDVYSHSEVPANDGGLSLGQALIARKIHAPA
jgi:hydrogenase maturation protein HypF